VKKSLMLGCVGACVALSVWAGVIGGSGAKAAAPAQSVLGPGLYVFQSRTRSSTCGDAEPDGYVLSFVAAIDGVPGDPKMKMQLVNTKYFVDWTIQVTEKEVLAESRIGTATDAPESHFEVRFDKDRFKGTGSRTYMGKDGQGKPQRCRVNYDALLKRLDI
jgi:hypothetical protein